MSIKRGVDADDGEIAAPQSKRTKTQSSKARQHQNSSIDPTWGQKYVFSSFDDVTTIPQGEESEFEDDSDAMAYLMSVSVPDADMESDEEGEIEESIASISVPDPRGYYDDGAYIGISEGWEENEGVNAEIIDADNPENPEMALQKAYFASVRAQYIRLRNSLHSKLPEDAATRLSSSQLTDASPFGRNSSTAKTWSTLIRCTDPHPLQVALMSKDTVIRILRVIIGGKFLRSGYTISERTSQWLWALVARLPDKGQLNHTEIGWVRDLGRRAVLLGRSLAEMAALREELAESGFGVNDNVDASSSDDEAVAEVVEDESERDEDNDTQEAEADAPDSAITPKVATLPDDGNNVEDEEEGEVDENDTDGEDVAMDIASDSEADEGEVTEQADDAATLEEAKRGLLAKIDEAENERRQEEEKQRARMNMRATLNMILTVAGEFYGQRDLLEFREPFVGM